MPELTIGRYEILKEIGQGGQSTAYKAKDPKINRIVAIKRMRSQVGVETSLQQEFIARFVREAQAAGRLSHPNIAVIYDVGDDNGEPYIAMEYIDGEHLGAILEREFPLQLSRIVDVFCQLCDGLDYAHKNQIIHRDIKPANVMLTKDGQVKIVDFGIAKLSSSNLTQTGYILGTPSYMSPELIMGRAIDHRSDIFSVGVMLYETLAGQLPFVGHNPTTVIYKIVNEQLPPLFVQRPDLPARLEMIVNKALAKGPEQRYQNCMDLAHDLKQIVHPERFPAKAVPEVTPAGAATAKGSGPDLHATVIPGTKVAPPVPTPPRQKIPSDREVAPEPSPPFARPADGGVSNLLSSAPGLLAKIPHRWLVPGAAAIAVLFLFAIWLIVRVTGAEEPPASTIVEETVVTTTVIAMIEDLNTVTTTLPNLAEAGGSGAESLAAPVSTRPRRTATTLSPGSRSARYTPTTTSIASVSSHVFPAPTLPPATIESGSSSSERQATRPVSTAKLRIQAEHDHWKGSCKGTLLLSDTTIEYLPREGDHRYAFSISVLRRFELKNEKGKTRLAIKAQDGKDYNFDVKDADEAQRLNSAYQRIAGRLQK